MALINLVTKQKLIRDPCHTVRLLSVKNRRKTVKVSQKTYEDNVYKANEVQ